MTPLELELCLHYHASPKDHPWINSGAPIVDGTMTVLCVNGLLVDTHAHLSERSVFPMQRYTPTEKLRFFVFMLCDTPLPQQQYFDPRTQTVIGDRQHG